MSIIADCIIHVTYADIYV
uniref:Uncharacterized protein n=1 Tax=Arundo donax TaxID=35708 RepID=A0A0A9ALB6_ARUDO